MLTWNEQTKAEFLELGYSYIGNIKNTKQFTTLSQKLDDIMMGTAKIDYDKLLMQLDSEDGAYENAGEQSLGFKGATLNYRKMQNLEIDPDFYQYVSDPIFQRVNADLYGDETPIAIFRAMFMNKPAQKGTVLPWHQDRRNYLDKNPMVTIYTAIDHANEENGCVQIIEGSHKWGLINPSHTSGFLTPEQAEKYCKDNVKNIILKPGDVVVLHNQALHASKVNRSNFSRRALSVCYMDATTKTIGKRKEEFYTPVFNNKELINA